MKRLLWLGLAVAALAVGASGCKVVVSNCVRDSDCPVGNVCSGGGSCVPVASDHTYVSCFSNSGCDVTDECWYVAIPATGTDGKFCSHQCTAASGCEMSFGYQGVCYSLPPNPEQLCYQRCATTADCYLDNKCTLVTLAGSGVNDTICMPNNHALP